MDFISLNLDKLQYKNIFDLRLSQMILCWILSLFYNSVKTWKFYFTTFTTRQNVADLRSDKKKFFQVIYRSQNNISL